MPQPIAPATMTIARAVQHSGLSRATLYRRAAEGHITFVKSGARTLVRFNSLMHYLVSLPPAPIRPAVI